MKGRKSGTISRRAVLAGGVLAGAGRGVLAGAPERSVRPLARARVLAVAGVPGAQEIIEKARLGGKMGFVVADALTGQVLESHNPLLTRPPASVAKALTAQYALDSLGPTHRFATRLVATGPLVSGRIEGDLVLVGGGDPLLDTTALAEMAARLKAAGVREVAGRFVVSSGPLPQIARIDPDQPDHLGYNPAVSGLNLNLNRVHFEWKRAGSGWNVTMDARTAKYRPEVALARMQIVDRRSPVYTFSASGGQENWTVARAALGKGGSRWLPVRHPALYAGEVFQTLARAQGLVLPAAVPISGTVRGAVLVRWESQPLRLILEKMLLHSVNLTAEVAGLSATIARGRRVRDLSGSAAEMTAWLKREMGLRKPRLVDHSGLSDRSRLAPSDMVAALLRTGPDSTLASILKPMKMRDFDGNLAPDSPYALRAKTGTLNFVSGLAGFLDTGGDGGSGRTLVFAMFSADMARRRLIRRADRERPPGARSWNVRAHRMQWALLNRWAEVYG